MFRHIRSKLIAAFAVPLAILVAVAGLEAAISLGQIKGVDRQTALASASVGPGGAVQDLQTERLYAVLDVVGNGENVTSSLFGVNPSQGGLYQTPSQVKVATDRAIDAFRSTVSSSGSQALKDFSKAFTALGSLPEARKDWASAANGNQITNYPQVATETWGAYTKIIDSLVEATSTVPLQISDPTLRTGVETLYTNLEKTEAQYDILKDMFTVSWSTGKAEKAAVDSVYQDAGANQSLSQRLNSFSHGAYHQAVRTIDGGPIDPTINLSLKLLRTEGIPELQTVLEVFSQPEQATTTKTDIQLSDSQIAAVVNARAAHLHDTAVEKAVLFSGVGLLGILLGLGLVVLVSRSISRPLVDLAQQAEVLATDTLPATVQAILESGTSGADPPQSPKVTVNSHDEVALMGQALEHINKTAVELAAGQAALRKSLADAFINLGRRNQNLVTRQLEYISEIEIKEADPESLEELFRLDHLATRMRRNAESLLILAGSGPARQWSAAVPAMDVARAASAEVEDYKRLRLHHFDPAQITGAVTTDLVHIMAELTENALTFSPPGSPVDIYGRFLEGGYVIVIVDSGIGMSAEDLEVANHRLEGEGSENEVPGRYLGHFVAGRLARRHGISISLQASHSGGLVARVKVPATLIEDAVPDLSAVAEVRSPEAAPSVASTPVTSSSPDEAAVEATSVEATLVAGAPSSLADAFGTSETLGSLAAPVAGTVDGDGGHDDGTFIHEDLSSLEQGLADGTYGDGSDAGYGTPGELPAWAGEITEPSWADDAEQDIATQQDETGTTVAYGDASIDEAVEPQVPEDYRAYEAPQAEPYEAPEAFGEVSAEPAGAVAEVPVAEVPVAEVPVAEVPVAEVHAAEVTQQPALPAGAPTAVATTPDLGAGAPLVAGSHAAHVPVAAAASSWDPVSQGDGGMGPAAQARSTVDGLRKLTRRVPGASLPEEDGSLRRETPTTTGRNPLGLTGALSQYLSATTNEGRTEKEQNAR